jgi:hypothetical protein
MVRAATRRRAESLLGDLDREAGVATPPASRPALRRGPAGPTRAEADSDSGMGAPHGRMERDTGVRWGTWRRPGVTTGYCSENSSQKTTRALLVHADFTSVSD